MAIKRIHVAAALQVAGIAALAVGLWWVRPWVGLLALGVGLVLLGVSTERGG
jgi:hypothetical protein